MPENFFLPETKDIDQQIDEAYEEYINNFDYEDGEPKSRQEYEDYWLS